MRFANGLYLGYNSGGKGVYNLGGSGELDALNECVGTTTLHYATAGTLTQSSGTNTTTAGLDFSYYSSGNGTYNLNGGTLILNLIITGSGKAAFNFDGVASVKAPTYTGTTNVSAGTLNFTGTLPGGNYAISGGTLNIGGLSKSIGTCQATGGTVTGTGTLTSNATYDVRGGTVAVNLAGNGIGLTKSGSTVAVLSGVNSYSGRTTVVGGTLELAVSAQNCVLNVGGADIQLGAMVFDYAGGADPIATIQSLLKASYDGGRWDVGQFHDSTASATGLTLGCFDNTAMGQVKVMATYPGDFNLDGVVDNQDRAIWFANAFTGSTWAQGDANYDGVVNGRDRDLALASLGLPPLAVMSPAAPAATAVPEPGAWLSWPPAC